MGQQCTSFLNLHACPPNKKSQYSRVAVVSNEMRPCERGGEEGAFVDRLLLLNFFHCCVRQTVNVVLCVTSSIAECGKIRLALDKNFCVFSVLITTEKEALQEIPLPSFKREKKKPHYGSQMFCVCAEVAKWSNLFALHMLASCDMHFCEGSISGEKGALF